MNTANTFDHGGYMGDLIRSYPWESTPLNALEGWPSPLFNALNVILISQQPMLIVWGEEKRCLFNDAYAESLSRESSDTLLGSRAATMDARTWSVLEAPVSRLMVGDHAASSAPHTVEVERNGVRDHVDWTYSFSPIEFDASRFGVGGVVVACAEASGQSRAAIRNEFFLALEDALHGCQTLHDLMAIATQLLGEHLKASRCDIGYWDTTQDVIELVEEWTDGETPRALGTHELNHYQHGVMENRMNGAPFIIKTAMYAVPKPGELASSIKRPIDLANSVIVAMKNSGRSPAVLLVQGADVRVWTQSEIAVVRESATRIWNAIEHLQIVQRLRESAQGFRALFDSSDTLFLLSDSQGILLDCNRRVEPCLNVSREGMIGQLVWDSTLGQCISPDARTTLQRAVVQASAGGIVRIDVPLTDESGHARVFEFSVYPIRDDRGEIALIAYEGRDVTAPALLAQKLSDADRRKDEFLATLSHELRNPLAALRSAARLIDSGDSLPDGKEQAARIIQRQVARMAQLMDDLSDVTRIAQGKLKLQKETVALSSVIDAAVECARPLIDRKRQTLDITMPAPRREVTVDPLRISQVVCNLLTNAAKYTDAEGHIDLRVRILRDELTLNVADSGIGLEAAAIDSIFSMFSQVEPGTVRSDGGLGIGLALVKGLTELHGGTVEAFSEGLGQGSTFLVTLPMSAERLELASDDLSSDEEEVFVPQRILVVDDNEEAATIFSELLRIDGHEVVTAFTGHSARVLAASFKPNFALLDISLPDMSGYELAHHLKAESWASQLTLVAMTGLGNEADRRRSGEAGFHAHLVKPVDDQKLKAILAPAIDGIGLLDLCSLAIESASRRG